MVGTELNPRGISWLSLDGDDLPDRLVLVRTMVSGKGIVVAWANASGSLRYLDSAGVEWQTQFRYRVVPTAGIEVEIVEVGLSSELGEPRYSGEGRAPVTR